jgi:PAS domain S-box-containing protein
MIQGQQPMPDTDTSIAGQPPHGELPRDEAKTKPQLIAELRLLRAQLAAMPQAQGQPEQRAFTPPHINERRGPAMFLASQELAVRKRAQRRLAVQYAVTRMLTEATNLEDAAARTLQIMGEELEWDLGIFWCLDPTADTLRCTTTWRPPSRAEADFDAIDRQMETRRGVGLAGRVWASGEPEWLTDIRREGHFSRLRAAGLHTAFAFPLRSSAGVAGVLEFFSVGPRIADDDLVRFVATIGNQIGQFADLKRAEAARRASVAREGAILKTALDGIVMLDAVGRIVEFSPAAERMFGRRRDEALGRQLVEFIPSLALWGYPNKDRTVRLAEESNDSTLGRHAEVMALRGDGRTFPAELTLTCVPFEEPPLFMACVRDIAERVRLEHQRDEFLGIASHELKTPLTTLKILTQLTRRRLERLGMLDAGNTARMERAILRMERIVYDLLDVSRIESGRLALRLEQCDLTAVCRQSAEEQEDLAERPIALDLPNEPIYARADADRIAQVLASLLANAVKFSAPGTPVTLALRRGDGTLTISVRDEGAGIPPEALPHLFERFYRVPGVQVQSGSGVGLGLGLYISREIAERHGGSITVESAVGGGSTFSFTLPLA